MSDKSRRKPPQRSVALVLAVVACAAVGAGLWIYSTRATSPTSDGTQSAQRKAIAAGPERAPVQTPALVPPPAPLPLNARAASGNTSGLDDRIRAKLKELNPSGREQQVLIGEEPADQPISVNPEFSILHFDGVKPEAGFLISLMKAPIALTRRRAESMFLKKMEISQVEACKLNVDVGVTYSFTVAMNIDDRLAGQNLGLSFCSNAVNLDGYK